MMDRKYAFEAFRNECVGVDDNDDSQGVPVLRGDEEHQETGREVGDQIRNQGCWNLEGTVFVPADQIEKVVIREVTE